MPHGLLTCACLACLGLGLRSHSSGAHLDFKADGDTRKVQPKAAVEEPGRLWRPAHRAGPLKGLLMLLSALTPGVAFSPSGAGAACLSSRNPTLRQMASGGCHCMPAIKMSAVDDLATRGDFLRSVTDFVVSLPLAVRLGVPFAGAFRAGAALSVIGQPRMPAVRGSYSSVGVRLVEVPGGSRAKVFYPAKQVEGLTDALYCTDRRKTSDGMAGLVGFRQIGLSFLLAHLADAQSGCLLNAPPVSANGEKLPLLVYSHGFGGNMDMATYFMRQLASYGIIVAALEHRDGTSSHTVLADGTEQDFAPRMLSGSDQLERRATELLAAIKPGVLGTDLAVDESRVFLGGHSYGGPAAILAAKKAATSRSALGIPKLAGLLLHDPALGMGSRNLVWSVASGALGCPVVSYTSNEYDQGGVRCGTTYHVNGCFHGNFVDAALWAPLWVMRTLSYVIPAAGPGDPAGLHALLARSGAKFMQNPSEDPKTLGLEEPYLEFRQ